MKLHNKEIAMAHLIFYNKENKKIQIFHILIIELNFKKFNNKT